MSINIDPSVLLKSKPRAIVVNNVHFKPLGSDPFFVGQMPLDRRWHIPLTQMQQYIEYLARFTKTIFIIGGEPREHPEWHNLLEMMHFYRDMDFVVKTRVETTNHKPPVDKDNVRYWAESMPKRGRNDAPILVGACDVLPGQSKRFYWNEARKYCKLWQHYPSPIYDNKAYFCTVAASFDRLLGENHGWKLGDGDCFDQSVEDIEQQAQSACFRCGCALYFKDPEAFPQQNTLDSSMASVVNLKQITCNNKVRPYYAKQFL